MACINAATASPGRALTPTKFLQGAATASRCDTSTRRFRLRHWKRHGVIATRRFALRSPGERVRRYCDA